MFTIGNIGHLFVISSFVSSICFLVGYLISEKNNIESGWLRFGKINYLFHTISILGVIACLYIILLSDDFRYYYAFQHSSILLLLFILKFLLFLGGTRGIFSIMDVLECINWLILFL